MSVADHREVAFESAIEAALVARGWIGPSAQGVALDRDLGVAPGEIAAFVEASQPKVWARLVEMHGSAVSATAKLARRVAEEIDRRGTLEVLRRGVTEQGVPVRLSVFRPGSGLSPEVAAAYAVNRCVVVRQLQFATGLTDELDLCLFVNGIPTATAELKNPLTGQGVAQAMKQYREDRDPKVPLLGRRALVHFAVDPDEVFMTTRLAGADTTFLPFNRGSESGGKGNPPNPGGYRSAYLWEQVWERDAWLELLQRFVHQDEPISKKPGWKPSPSDRVTVFPRYHQWDGVRRLLASARAEGPGSSYLVQHSAGSGKTKTIAWLAHGLTTLHDESDQRVFHKIVVVTDRVVLDAQLQAQIFQFEQQRGVVQQIDQDSQQLRSALAGEGAQIIVTTLQKFPVVWRSLEEDGAALKARRYAVIVDEAHSSQTGESATALKAVLGAKAPERDDLTAEADDDVADALAKSIAARGAQPNVSFFAFTATPKAKTLELFGRKDADGRAAPFHLYPMRQAIEEGFILDVLQNYTTYDTLFKLARASDESDEEFEKAKAAAAIARFVHLHPYAIAQKVEVVVEHYRQAVRHRIGGRAKAMVVTDSRKSAVRWKQGIDAYIAEKGYADTKALVAFSGTVRMDEQADWDLGAEYTEPGLNGGLHEAALPAEFAKRGFGVLIVAEKYQTGFDQPLLHTMYVDKKLAGVNAVQTLSRLNRMAPGKEETFVLDFRNTAEEIEAAFAPFYECTIAEETDPNALYDALRRILEPDVIHDDEVTDFVKAYHLIGGANASKNALEESHQLLYALTDLALDRFYALDEEEQGRFRTQVGRYVRLYAFLSQVIPYVSAAAEKLYLYARFLKERLPGDGGGRVDLGRSLLLTHYKVEEKGTASIGLAHGDPLVAVPPGGGEPTAQQVPLTLLSDLIELFNERFGLGLTDAERLPVEYLIRKLADDPTIQQQARANDIAPFMKALESQAMDVFVDANELSGELYRRLLDDQQVRDELLRVAGPWVWRQAREEEPDGDA